MKRLILVLLLALAVPVSAQQRPIAGTTIQTTDTTANSALIGCAVGSTACTGGIKAGPIVSSSGTFTTLNNVVGTSATFTGAGAFTVTNSASQAFGVRYNAANPAIGFIIANSNGFPYIGYNAKSKVSSDTATYDIAGFASQFRMDNGGFMFLTAPSGSAAADITFTQRWGINNAGDWTYGTSANIADSGGAPSCNSGACTGAGAAIAGTDYAMRVTTTTAASTTFTVLFGHAFANAPVCVAMSQVGLVVAGTSVSTSTFSVNYPSTATNVWTILCRSY